VTAVNSANHFVRLSSFCSPPFDLLPFRSLVMDQPHSPAAVTADCDGDQSYDSASCWTSSNNACRNIRDSQQSLNYWTSCL